MSSTRRAARALAPALLAVLAIPAAAAAQSSNTWSAVTQNQCGGPGNTFTVPDDVHTIHAIVSGAAGQPTGVMSIIGAPPAQVQADISVTPGQTLYACLNVSGGVAGAGGAGKGGGFGEIGRAADGFDPILLAGGGGGSGGPVLAMSGPLGGAATLPQQAPINPADALWGTAGGSASDIASGAGGVNTGHPGDSGAAGAHYAGGAGAPSTNGLPGGGGGGGYWGGGGGAGSNMISDAGTGGGGGSSYCEVACHADLLSGITIIPPSVTLSWYFAPAFSVPDDVAFGGSDVGAAAAKQTVTVKNSGLGPLFVSGEPDITGDAAGDFSLAGNTCTGALVDPGDTCAIEVAFTPSTVGTRSAALTVNAAGIDPVTVNLTGSGNPVGDPPPPPAPPVPPVTTPGPQTPAPTACVSRRVVDLKVPGIYRKALISAKAQIAGKTVANLKNGKGQIDLRGRTAGKVKVTLVIKLRGGRTRTDVRTYTTCGK